MKGRRAFRDSTILDDIAPLIAPKLAGWPRDTPPSSEVLCDLARGDNITLQPVESRGS